MERVRRPPQSVVATAIALLLLKAREAPTIQSNQYGVNQMKGVERVESEKEVKWGMVERVRRPPQSAVATAAALLLLKAREENTPPCSGEEEEQQQQYYHHLTRLQNTKSNSYQKLLKNPESRKGRIVLLRSKAQSVRDARNVRKYKNERETTVSASESAIIRLFYIYIVCFIRKWPDNLFVMFFW